MNDPLESLLVDAVQVDRAKLAECLRGVVGLDNTTGVPVLLPDFVRLPSAKLKALAYMAGIKAAALLGKADDEYVRQSELSEALGIASGTIGRTMRELASERIVVQDDRRRYAVPSHQLSRVQEMLTSNRN